jgi:hypothetical protein
LRRTFCFATTNVFSSKLPRNTSVEVIDEPEKTLEHIFIY